PAVSASSPGGMEGSPIPVAITPVLVDTDGSEVLQSIRVRGVPVGATFNHGSLVGTFGGLDVWGLAPADLSGLTLTVPDGPPSVSLLVTAFPREVSNLSTAESSVPVTFQVANVAPVATIAGPAEGVRGQVRSFTLAASDPSTGDAAAGFTYSINW